MEALLPALVLALLLAVCCGLPLLLAALGARSEVRRDTHGELEHSIMRSGEDLMGP